jgi:hypothetical protein
VLSTNERLGYRKRWCCKKRRRDAASDDDDCFRRAFAHHIYSQQTFSFARPTLLEVVPVLFWKTPWPANSRGECFETYIVVSAKLQSGGQSARRHPIRASRASVFGVMGCAHVQIGRHVMASHANRLDLLFATLCFWHYSRRVVEIRPSVNRDGSGSAR